MLTFLFHNQMVEKAFFIFLQFKLVGTIIVHVFVLKCFVLLVRCTTGILFHVNIPSDEDTFMHKQLWKVYISDQSPMINVIVFAFSGGSGWKRKSWRPWYSSSSLGNSSKPSEVFRVTNQTEPFVECYFSRILFISIGSGTTEPKVYLYSMHFFG